MRWEVKEKEPEENYNGWVRRFAWLPVRLCDVVKYQCNTGFKTEYTETQTKVWLEWVEYKQTSSHHYGGTDYYNHFRDIHPNSPWADLGSSPFALRY